MHNKHSFRPPLSSPAPAPAPSRAPAPATGPSTTSSSNRPSTDLTLPPFRRPSAASIFSGGAHHLHHSSSSPGATDTQSLPASVSSTPPGSIHSVHSTRSAPAGSPSHHHPHHPHPSSSTASGYFDSPRLSSGSRRPTIQADPVHRPPRPSAHPRPTSPVASTHSRSSSTTNNVGSSTANMPRAVNSPRPVDIVAARLDQQLEMMMQELAMEAAQVDAQPASPATSLPATPTFARRPSLPPLRPLDLNVPPVSRSSHHSDADSGRGSTYSNAPRSPLPSSPAGNLNNTTSMMTGGSTGSMSMALTLEDQGAAGNDFLAQMLGDLHTLYASDEEEDGAGAADAYGYAPHPDSGVGDLAPSAEPMPATMGRRPSVTGPGASAAQAQARNRARAVHEIVQTEATYVEMLSALVELVVRPLREALASGTAKKLGYSADDLNKIFGNVEEILGLHVTLLDGLRERYSLWTNDTKISDLFMTILPFLKMYQLYMSMYANAVVTLTRCRKSSPDLNRLISAAEAHQRFKGLQILSFLILPIQRIPRYILLLENLAKFTPDTHPDFDPLHKCVESVKHTAEVINEAIRGFEAQKRAIAVHARLSGRPEKLPSLVAPARKFLGESVDFSIRSKALASAGLGLDARRAVAVFLFSDLIVIAKRLQTSAPVVALGGGFSSSVPPSESEKWEWRDEVYLPRAWISDEPDVDPNEFALRIVGADRAVTLFATTLAVRDTWRDKVQAAMDAVHDPASAAARGRSLSRSGPSSFGGVISGPMDPIPPSPTSSTWSGRSGSDRASRSSHGTSWFSPVPPSPSAYSMRRPSVSSPHEHNAPASPVPSHASMHRARSTDVGGARMRRPSIPHMPPVPQVPAHVEMPQRRERKKSTGGSAKNVLKSHGF